MPDFSILKHCTVTRRSILCLSIGLIVARDKYFFISFTAIFFHNTFNYCKTSEFSCSLTTDTYIECGAIALSKIVWRVMENDNAILKYTIEPDHDIFIIRYKSRIGCRARSTQYSKMYLTTKLPTEYIYNL